MSTVGQMSLQQKLFFEIVPIALAMLAIISCIHRAIVTQNKVVRNGSLVSAAAALLMIAAQVSWSWSVFIKGDAFGTEMANVMWTVFNATVMAQFIYTSRWIEK